MDVRRLRSFVQIADCGSITRAAAEAGLAQPALSQQLAGLEQELGVRLLDRSATGVKLTPAGAVLYDRAQVILQQLDDLRDDVQHEADRLSGPVAIGLPPSMVDLLTLPLLVILCREHPNLRPQIVEEGSAQLQDLLIRGTLEIAVSPMRPDNPAVGSELLFREPLVLAAPAELGLPDQMALPDLARLPWVTTQRRHAVRVMVDALFAEAGLKPRVVAEIDSLSTVVRFVQRGLGVAILPQKVAEHARDEGGLTILATAAPLPERSMFLCWRRSTQSSRRTDFVLDLVRTLAHREFPRPAP